MQCGSAMFAAAATTDNSVECLIHHEMRTLPASGPRSWAHAGTWINVFFLAVAVLFAGDRRDLARSQERVAGHVPERAPRCSAGRRSASTCWHGRRRRCCVTAAGCGTGTT
ncbi:Imm49 family immunity protein [Streptomyces subrutilus]|uniref:Imm49 family immunity protein n=1 Tax=Streptomyces subrutilus TaxID=36818 RepID=UPI0033D20616